MGESYQGGGCAPGVNALVHGSNAISRDGFTYFGVARAAAEGQRRYERPRVCRDEDNVWQTERSSPFLGVSESPMKSARTHFLRVSLFYWHCTPASPTMGSSQSRRGVHPAKK